ncbi:hypothetical protein EDC01DRAFT_673552 [Geopyxis carbonaria]|nr:hypothetical protein EDC01DRAFT_673552 [Geopyxis carbonaria]
MQLLPTFSQGILSLLVLSLIKSPLSKPPNSLLETTDLGHRNRIYLSESESFQDHNKHHHCILPISEPIAQYTMAVIHDLGY